MRAHCSVCAPGGVSQRICQSPWTERTAPWALAGAAKPSQHKTADAAAIPATHRAPAEPGKARRGGAELVVGCFEGPIGVDPLISSANFVGKNRTHPTDTAMTAP